LLLAASFFPLFSSGQITAQSPAPATLVKAGRLHDPRTGNVLSPAAVLIENGKIKEVGCLREYKRMRRLASRSLILAAPLFCPG
jgi:hypothetical protein